MITFVSKMICQQILPVSYKNRLIDKKLTSVIFCYNQKRKGDKMSTPKKKPKKAAKSKEVEFDSPEMEKLLIDKKKELSPDNTERNDLFLKIFVALCSNPDSPKKAEELVFSAQSLTVEALKGCEKEEF